MTTMIRNRSSHSQRFVEVFHAFGHENVLASHTSTIEITVSPILTLRGDCIIGVRASKAAKDFSEEFRMAARQVGAQMVLALQTGASKEVVMGCGSPNLAFLDPTRIILRKSNYACGATVMVGADKSARDLDRRLVSTLRQSEAKLSVTLTVTTSK